MPANGDVTNSLASISSLLDGVSTTSTFDGPAAFSTECKLCEEFAGATRESVTSLMCATTALQIFRLLVH